MIAQPSNIIIRKPVTSFLVLTLLISYVLGIPFNMFAAFLLNGEHEVITGIIPRLVTVYGPATAALVVTAFFGGHRGVRTLLQKLVPRRTDLGWIIGIPILFTALTFTAFMIGGTTVKTLLEFFEESWQLLIFQFIGQIIIVGFGEELGWRGWLLPKLTQRLSLGSAFLLVTLVWGLWHFPLFFNPLRVVVAWFMILISISAIITWIWVKVQGNVFVLAVAHASINAPEMFLENRLSKTTNGYPCILSGWETMGYVYLSVAAILAIFTYRLWYKKNVPQNPTAEDQSC